MSWLLPRELVEYADKFCVFLVYRKKFLVNNTFCLQIHTSNFIANV